MAEIDRLEINVTANVDGAISGLNRLASAVGRVNGASQSAGSGMQVLQSETQHAAEGTERAGREASDAAGSLRRFGREAEDSGKAAKKSTSGILSFWQALKRVAYMRFLRYIVKSIAAGFKEGISNLYQWSSAVNGHFKQSMDRIATSTLYLKNSLGAMVAPLIESLAPVLDWIIDKLVTAMNFFNMLLASLSGRDTYTIAKKVATVWDDSSETIKDSAGETGKAVKELQRTILGFDEINKLNKPAENLASPKTGGDDKKKTPAFEDMFEEKPLTGFLKDLSDFGNKVRDVTKGWPTWLKWLLGIGAAAGLIFGIVKLLKWLKNLKNRLFDLKNINLPGWLKKLFGGGWEGDKEVKVDLDKGDWSIMDDLKKPVKVHVGLDKDGWNNLSAWMGNTVVVHVGLDKDGWNNLSAWIGNTIIVHVMLAKDGWNNLAAWIGNSVLVNVMLLRDGWNSLKDWIGSDDGVLVPVGLKHWGWENLLDWIGNVVTVLVGLRKWGWDTISKWTGADDGVLVPIGLKHWGWDNLKDWIGNAVTVLVGLNKDGWSTLPDFIGSDDGVIVPVGLKHWGWDNLNDWIGNAVSVAVGLKKWGWTSIEDFVNGGGSGSSGGSGGGNGLKIIDILIDLIPDAWKLWKKFKDDWNGKNNGGGDGGKKVDVDVELSNTPQSLFSKFRAKWNGIHARVLSVSLGIATLPLTLWEKFKDNWNGLRAKVLSVGLAISTLASSLFTDFKTKWNTAAAGGLSIGVTLSETADSLWDGLKAGWNGVKQGVAAAKEGIARGLEVGINLVKDGWTSVSDWLSQNGATVKTTAAGLLTAALAIGVTLVTGGAGAGAAAGMAGFVGGDDFGLMSPKEYREIAKTLPISKEGAGRRQEFKSKSVTKPIQSMMDELNGIINTGWETAKSTTSEAWRDILTTALTGVDNIGNGLDIDLKPKIIDKLAECWQAVWDDTAVKWTGIQGTVMQSFTNLTTGFELKLPTFETMMHDCWSNIESDTKTIWGNIEKAVKDYIRNIKSAMQMPHFYVNWATADMGWLGSFSYPRSLGVNWYARGGILDGAQIFGRMGDMLLGGGEAGREAVLPLEQNTGWMDTLADRIYDNNVQRAQTDGTNTNGAELAVMNAMLTEMRSMLNELRGINEKDFSAQITTSDINRAQSRANRRAGVTVAPVGGA